MRYGHLNCALLKVHAITFEKAPIGGARFAPSASEIELPKSELKHRALSPEVEVSGGVGEKRIHVEEQLR
jgi:hypothetical protein